MKNKKMLSKRTLIIIAIISFIISVVCMHFQEKIYGNIHTGLKLSIIFNTITTICILQLFSAKRNKNPKYAHDMEIILKDERVQNIMKESKAKAFDLIPILLGVPILLLLIANMYTQIMITLLVVEILFLIIQQFFYKKFLKEM